MPRTFSFEPDDHATRIAAETAVFGKPLENQEDYGNLVGDIADDATVRVIFNHFFVKKSGTVPITLSARSSTHSTVVRLDKDMFDYSDCTVADKGKGIGRKIFRLLAETARRLGFKEIRAEGRERVSEKEPCWGHITYPGYGFDQPIPAEIAAELPEELKHVIGVMDLCADPNGLEFWEKKGETLKHMKFNLEADSPSWQRFEKGSIRKRAVDGTEAAPAKDSKPDS